MRLGAEGTRGLEPRQRASSNSKSRASGSGGPDAVCVWVPKAQEAYVLPIGSYFSWTWHRPLSSEDPTNGNSDGLLELVVPCRAPLPVRWPIRQSSSNRIGVHVSKLL